MTVISVVIPFCNAAAMLGDAIGSAIAQTEVEREIVAVDDGSTDDSLTIARSFEPSLHTLTGPNRGVSNARNRGIAETSGEWIVFLDADDLLVPGTLQQRLETAVASGADVVVCDWREFRDNAEGPVDGAVKMVDFAVVDADAEAGCATSVWAATAALMYRRRLVEEIGGFREDLPVIQDARFLFDAAHRGAKFAHSAHVGARYRLSPHSLSRDDPARFWRDCLLNGQQIEALWQTQGMLTARRATALADIYNGAAYGLFRAADPAFREALAALRRSGMAVGRRNRLAELLADVVGHRRALKVTDCWTRLRQALTGGQRPPVPG